MKEKSWNVTYPNGVIKYIDMFRKKYFQYPVFDKVVSKYIDSNSIIQCKKICSLGSGTGRHEVELAKLGYEVIGLERNEESLEIANKYIKQNNVNVQLHKCDFLKEDELDNVMAIVGKVDAVVLLLIPISISDYKKAAINMHKWINNGGVFIVDNFGYEDYINPNELKITSNCEVASDDDSYSLRINYYEYMNNIVNWDAIYLFYDEFGKLVMSRDHDILDIIPETQVNEILNLNTTKYKTLNSYRVNECTKYICPPYLYEYIIGWLKSDEEDF
ncbi:class I SAM-dependent methyltransferase [Thomasclavelia cocleata]|uniref:class I SAM-dependent methyltransferase n=1 Tax=Thomasclavelia cocleata TaxID=69824 RepID=UPI00272E9E28|nr:class I SAM-dependent methyltransferase [Thomasclavelia cocleata]